MKILINWLLFISVIAVNALANILPINGLNTGQVSDFYPNTFVPAGFTFSIWGLIYLLLLCYTISVTYFFSHKERFEKAVAFIDRINGYFLFTCILNISWIIAWHYLQIELSVFIMLLFLLTLIQLFLKSFYHINSLNFLQRQVLHLPFMIYLGWISVATIANITALLVANHWNGFGLKETYWSALMVLIAIMLGWYLIYRFKLIAFSLVIAWALWGIYNAQGPAAPLLANLTALGIGFLSTASLITLFIGLRKNKMT